MQSVVKRLSVNPQKLPFEELIENQEEVKPQASPRTVFRLCLVAHLKKDENIESIHFKNLHPDIKDKLLYVVKS